ncbi:MAG: hypothetical protein JO359_05010 [Candidatus Eremiobacteraeota bacterium]|nr:hypothetical protein [Candidatus Eremiobacteraeota bacterium]
MNLRPLGAALGLAAFFVGGSVATTSVAQAQTAPIVTPVPAWMRGERGSARNLIYVRRRLEAMIDQLQHDQHDYGGYRVQAITSLQQARAQIVEALQYDTTHGH